MGRAGRLHRPAAGRRRPIPGTPSSHAAAGPTSKIRPPYADNLDAVLKKYLKPTKDHPKHPGYAGAVALVLQDGTTRLTSTAGDALRYAAGPVELPPAKRVAMRPNSIFDLASLTKVYTAILTLQLVDQGKVDLSAPIQKYLPEFTGAGKDKVTVAMLLAHTSALPVGAAVTGFSTDAVVKQMLTDVNKGKPATDPDRPGRTADHGLGVEIAQPWFMGKLSSATSFGHTGFTGTSLLVVPSRRLVVALLTNRAHPNWSWSNPDVHRVAVHNTLA